MIELAHVGLRYKGGPEVLTDVNLTIAPKSFHYLTGSSGSGKTSLMRLLSINLLPTRGTVTFSGQDIQSISRKERARLRQKIGIVFQNFRLLPHLSVFDNIALPLRLQNISEAKIQSSVRDIANWIGLKDYLNVKPAFISGGQQQRVAIARAVIVKPEILLADEPTGSLDDPMGDQIMVLFEELNKQGTAILIATHNQGTIERFPHPAIRLQSGGTIES